MTSPLDALGPLDGRYHSQVAPLAAYFSERALIITRVQVELAWLRAIAPLFPFSANADLSPLDDIGRQIAAPNEAERVKELEQETRHDVKAAEYWLHEQLQQCQLGALVPLVHFGCTSWDINNIAMGRMITGALRESMIPCLESLLKDIHERAHQYADVPMLARTHGQPASPTTVGKEFAVFYARLSPRLSRLREWHAPGKMSGATGNYNTHYAARPDVDWPQIARQFVEGQGMIFASHTTQIEPYDDFADLFNLLRGVNNIVLDLCRDMWGYVALEYFRQPPVAGEVGSSTMPHKINPIDFENAEGNIGVGNALLAHLSDKLPVSRWQRDLSDSTVVRNIGLVFGHVFLAWSSARRGLARSDINTIRMDADLDDNWQVLSEAVLTVMRAEDAGDEAYEQLKDFSRGVEVSPERLHGFIRELPISDKAKESLLSLEPRNYCGIAARLAKEV